MKIYFLVFLLLFGLLSQAQEKEKLPKKIYFRALNQNKMNKIIPPKAKKIPKELSMHGDKRVDNYFWLKERGNPEVIKYLEKENKYCESTLAHTKDFQAKLFEEIKGRIKQEDTSVPYKYNKYWYLSEYKKGDEHPIYLRKKENLKATSELLFDINELAKNYKYYNLDFKVSPDNKKVGFAVDTLGNRIYTLHFKDLQSDKLLKDTIEKVSGNFIWADDNKTIFYTKLDKALRPFGVFKHVLGNDPKNDELIFEEKDELYNLSLSKSKSREYLFIHSGSKNSDEFQILKADKPNDKWQIFQKREKDFEYSIEHFKDHFYILTNKDGASNFKVMKTSTQATQKEHWEEFIPYREEYLIEGFEVFEHYFVLEQRHKGLVEFSIQSWDKKNNYKIDFGEETYVAALSTNKEMDTPWLRYYYSSLTTPASIIDFDMQLKEKIIKKEQEIPDKSFKKENYTSERIWATARDGKKIPISLVYHKNTKKSSTTPLLLYGYGSYGYTIDPSFSVSRLSLLDRGFIFAIAHIRGGQYLGRSWYEEGKMLHKKNTFYDFIDAANYLVENKFTSSKHLYGMGGSAGGLLMGAVMNIEPKLFNGIIAAVPFVDVTTTMLDESLPLTIGEYEEWGNPQEKKYYDYIKSYSPYDNVEQKEYPHLLVTTGLHDSQVAYFEPAKWVAKLRELKKGDQKLLLKTQMEVGHSGSSGRFEHLKEVTLNWAFLLDLENKVE